MISVFAFDIFGTLVSMEGVPREEMEAYGNHIRQPEWSPLVLPNSWRRLKAFDDVSVGFGRLQCDYKTVVTLSNAPLMTQDWLIYHNGLDDRTDLIVPLELIRVFKPNIEAYKCLFRLFPDIKPEEFCMVSANKHFGDIEAARSLGMKAVLIRGDTGIDVSDLAGMAERGEI